MGLCGVVWSGAGWCRVVCVRGVSSYVRRCVCMCVGSMCMSMLGEGCVRVCWERVVCVFWGRGVCVCVGRLCLCEFVCVWGEGEDVVLWKVFTSID